MLSNSENSDLVDNCINSLFLGRPVSGTGFRRGYAQSDAPVSEKEREIHDSIVFCLLIYDVHGLTAILKKLHDKRRYAKEFFAKLDSDPDAVIESWTSGIAAQKELVHRLFFDANSKYRTAVEDLIGLSREFSQGNNPGVVFLRNVKDLLPEILTDDPDKFCKALSAYGSVKSGNARMGTKDVFGDSLDKLRRSYKLLKDFYSSLPADLIAIITTYISADIPRTIEILEHLGRVFNALEDMIENAKRGMGAADFTDMIDLTYLL